VKLARRLLVPAALAVALASGGCPREAPPPAPRPLTILMGAEPTTLDPHIPFDNVSAAVLGNIFDSLVHFDTSLRLQAGLAVRWINPDDRTWRFFLDPGARFHDGTALRASDVKFSIERVKSLPDSEIAAFVRHVAAVEAVDDLTVDLHTDAPLAILNSLAFVPIVSESHVRASGASVAESPMGTGPYRLSRWERGRAIVLEANEHYRPTPRIRTVAFQFRSPGAEGLADEIASLRPELTFLVRLSVLEELQRRRPAGLKVVASEGLAVVSAALNLRSEVRGKGRNPLRDLRVRRALAHATDRGELIREVVHGFGRPATQLVVPEVFGSDPGIGSPAFDPPAARRLLAETGRPVPELTLLTDAAGSQRLEKALARQWETAGIRTKVVALAAQELRRAQDAGEFHATLLGWICSSADASEVLSFLLHTRDAALGLGTYNFTGYSNSELDRLSEENPRVFDPRKRLEMLQSALRLAAADLPLLPLYSLHEVYVVSDALAFEPRLDGEIRVSEMSLRPAPR
jgi:peptide/nickel transport system substrate-binding protein